MRVKKHASWVLNGFIVLSLGAFAICETFAATVPVWNVRDFGATGDGTTLDTVGINRAIDEAHSSGGGTVFFPAGNYLSVSIHLKSNITLYLDQGAIIIAATTSETAKYDPPEPNEWDKYQDF